jgi:5-methylcytosine-specific restriction enzyme A
MDQLPFIPNQLYNRRFDIHQKYGGNPQSGISASAKTPFIFIFSGKTGNKHGYKDAWESKNIFSYTGEGQSGDMEFTKGNLALRDHLQNGKRVFLFESTIKGGPVRFVDEVQFYDVGYFETHDNSGKTRQGIKFFLKRRSAVIAPPPELYDINTEIAAPIVEYNFRPPNSTERKGLVTSRVGQGAYRKSIIYRWDCKCAVTGFDRLDTLIASHIVPWSESTDIQRLDVSNGILLSPAFDALFDRHLITFENSGKIALTSAIVPEAFHKIGVSGNERIRGLNSDNHFYLEKHRDRFGKLNGAS